MPHDEALRDPRRRRLLPGGAGGARQERRRASAKTDEELDHAIRQIISRRSSSDEVVDIFAAAGLKKPDISILSDEFLAEVRGMPQRNLAVELLQKLLDGRDQDARRGATSSRRARSPSCWSRRSASYQNRAIETAQVIEELIALAKEMRAGGSPRRGARPHRRRARLLRRARDQRQRRQGPRRRRRSRRSPASWSRRSEHNVTIDWTVRENVRAQLRVLVKRILRKYGYPPDKQEKATQTVLEQAEVLSEVWAVA